MAEYYVPSESDIIRGLEYYEYDLVERKWLKRQVIHGEADWDEDLISGIEANIPDELIKVKYLESQDIQELGWEYNGQGFSHYTQVYSNDSGDELHFEPFYNIIKIFLGGSSHKCIYSGKCYNKSELRWIMDRLGINTEK